MGGTIEDSLHTEPYTLDSRSDIIWSRTRMRMGVYEIVDAPGANGEVWAVVVQSMLHMRFVELTVHLCSGALFR